MFRKLLLICLLICVVEGCYTTVVRIDSVPPGSTVHWDYQPKGETPVEFEVDWYGAHRLALDHPDFGQRIEKVELKAPAHLWFPFDFFVAILPFKVTDRHALTFDLPEEKPSSVEEKIDEPKIPKSSKRRR